MLRALVLTTIGTAVVLASPRQATTDVPVAVESAWIREGPPVMTTFAGYMVLRNRGERREVVRSAHSADFERIEFHRATIVDGVASMHPQASIEIPAAGRIALEPGGMHLMLIGAGRALRSGDEVEIVLSLESGAEIRASFPVRREAPQ